MRHPTLLILFAIFVGGCTSALTPPVQEFTIYPSHHSSTPTKPFLSKTLRLVPTKTIPSLTSRNLVYLYDSGEIGNYLYTRWSDAPSTLIERSLLYTLQDQRVFETLLTNTSSAQSDWVLESDLHAFYHRFETNQKSFGVIDITYRLIDAKTKHAIDSKRFYISIEASGNNAVGGVNALSEATSELTSQCTQWIKEKVNQ